MARPDQAAIDTFISITGASQSVALQKLQAHAGDLNQAVNSYFSEGDRNSTREASIVALEDDAMDIDEPPPLSLLPSSGMLNTSSLLDPGPNSKFIDTGADSSNPAPVVALPREVRGIPTEVKDGGGQSDHSRLAPAIEDVTGTDGHSPGSNGTVIIDDDDVAIPISQTGASVGLNEKGHNSVNPSAPPIDDLPDYHNDIEEEMIRAAIEASKREVGVVHADQLYGRQEDPRASDLAHAVSLSLKTAEQEKALREVGGSSELEANKSTEMADTGKMTLSNGRLDVGSSSVQDEAENVEDQPLVRHRSRRIASTDSAKEDVDVDVTPPSSPEQDDDVNHPSQRGSEFPEWGGITSEEHDEAVMLEAAMFGGIPETSGYRLPQAPHHFMANDLDRNSVLYSQQFPRPPSPSLVAQRLIREQQDDEYLASLQADKEKAEARLLEEEAAREEEMRKEEESRRNFEAEQEVERQLAAKEASLPPEPTLDNENAVTLLVKMPDGNRRGRRFLKSDKLQYLFDFIDVGRGVKPGTYKLVRPYPRRAFSDGESSLTLNELSLTSKQEALFLELIKT